MTEKEFFDSVVAALPSIWACAKTLFDRLDVYSYNLIRVSNIDPLYRDVDANGGCIYGLTFLFTSGKRNPLRVNL